MAIQTPKSYATQQQDILAALQNTGITQTAPGGKARAFADIVASKLNEVEVRQFENLNQTLLPYATGESLDFIGSIYGIMRIPRSDAATSASDGSFTFYVQSGTFGSINSGQNMIIPAGTKVFTTGSNQIAYSISYQVTLLSGTSSQSFAATSLLTGIGGNAPASSIVQHNFTNYTQSGLGTLLVTNNFGIVSGRDVEDDESYRYRIQLALQTVGGSSQSDITVKLLTVPGVQNVSFEDLPGTFNVYVYTTSSNPSDYVIQLVQAILDETTAFPIKGNAISPDLVGISLVTTLHLSSTLSLNAQSTVVSNAISAVTDYINNLGVGGTLIINNLASIILQSDPNILDIGLPNKPILQLFIWRSREDSTRYSRNLVQDYTLALGERLVIENITNPVNLTVS